MTRFITHTISYLSDSLKRLFWLRQIFRLLAVVLAGLHTWAAAVSHSMNPDGVSYLDIGDAYFRGDWDMAINTVWSPLYSWILGVVMWLFEPPMRWEFPMVHLINFGIFLLTLVAFEFMWKRLLPVTGVQFSAFNNGNNSEQKQVGMPEWAWWAVGYLLFIWATLNMIHIWAVTPDMILAAFMFWAAGLVAQIRASRASWPHFILLGCVLGLGYLSKSIMLPVSVFFLAAIFVAVGNWRQAVVKTTVTLVCLLLVAGPFVVMMSLKNGRFTYGDAGKFTYVRHVNHVVYPHWQGEPPEDGVPLHPSRRIFDNPPMYEFGEPIGGTYPISFDQSYWYEGIKVRFDLANQLRRLLASVLSYVDLFVFQMAGILFGIGMLYSLRKWSCFSLKSGFRGFLVSAIGLMGLILYTPILVDDRYVGAFVLIFLSDLLARAHIPASDEARRIIQSVSLLMIFFLLVNIAMFNMQGFSDLSAGRSPPGGAETAGPPDWPGAVAKELWQLGVTPGAKVAVIGYAFDSYWARLARVKIVAETPGWQADALWLGDPVFQREVLAAFAGTGARAIVAEYVPPYADVTGWHQVDNSNFYIFLLDD